MNLIREFRELGKSIISCFFLFFLFFLFFFLFTLKKIELLGIDFFLPLPAIRSFSVQFFERVQRDLLPPGVQLIVVNPFSAFLAQIVIALFLGFIFCFPFFLYKIISYLSSALFEGEKKAVFKVLIPSVMLFISGCIFAYFALIPSTFKVLYSYAAAIKAISFFSINEFITLTFGLMIATGTMFLLPIFMVLLTWFKIVKKDFWRENWRYAILIFLVLSAIITPDGTGITMLILSLPLIGLYFLGYSATLLGAR